MKYFKIQQVPIFLLISIFYFVSCKKVKYSQEPQQDYSFIEKRFFTASGSSNLIEKSLINFLKEENSKNKFVEKVVSQIGYPRWDKIITTGKPAMGTNRGNSDSSQIIYYLPFVRDSQNYVNSAMVIFAGNSDTTFGYKCDWQYHEFLNSDLYEADSAENYAVFFMSLNNRVFGHKKFEIIDTSLFYNGGNKPLYITLDSVVNSSKSNTVIAVDHCWQVTVTYQVSCNPSRSVSDFNKTNISFVCYSQTYHTYCWTEYINTDEDGGTGSSTGGGGNNGVPPECNNGITPLKATTQTLPCGTGWIPGTGTDTDPVTFNGVTYTITNYPGYNFGFPWKWWENSNFLQAQGGLSFGSWAINYLSLNSDLDFSTFINWFFSIPEYTFGDEIIDPDLITYDEQIVQAPLPSLSLFQNSFPKLGTPGNYVQMPSEDVYEMVGGSLYSNHLTGNPNYQNACALRGSRGLLYSGISIPVLRYNGGQRTEKGSDNKNYILDAVTFNKFMIDKFGETSYKLTGADLNSQNIAELLKGKNGIYVILNNNSSLAGYSGHVDLILNGKCIGNAYTTPAGGIKSIRIWVLN